MILKLIRLCFFSLGVRGSEFLSVASPKPFPSLDSAFEEDESPLFHPDLFHEVLLLNRDDNIFLKSLSSCSQLAHSPTQILLARRKALALAIRSICQRRCFVGTIPLMVPTRDGLGATGRHYPARIGIVERNIYLLEGRHKVSACFYLGGRHRTHQMYSSLAAANWAAQSIQI